MTTTTWIIIGVIVLIVLILFFKWLSNQAKETLVYTEYVTKELSKKPTCPVCHTMINIKDSNYKKSGSRYRQFLVCPNCGHHISASRNPNKSEYDLEYINNEIEKNPGNAYTWFTKGTLEEKLGRYPAARNSYEKAIKLGWDNKIVNAQDLIEKLKKRGY